MMYRPAPLGAPSRAKPSTARSTSAIRDGHPNRENKVKRTRATLILFSSILTLALATACQQTGPKVETTVTEKPGGLLVVQTVEHTATVVAIDAIHRKVTIQPPHGDPEVVKVSEGAVNFQNIRVGDEVRAVVIEETAVNLVPGGAPESLGAATAVSLAPEGGRPGAVVADTVETTATVVGIDAHAHTITLQFLDGRVREMNVGKHRDLSKVGLGDSIRIQFTEAIAISVTKP
jgi:hypothetical protein